MPDGVRLGFIPANRGFFSDVLAAEMREQAIAAMNAQGITVIVPDPKQTKAGTIGTYKDARVAGQMFRDSKVDGIIVGAVNFGDESSVAQTVMQAGLNVPILIFGCQETGQLSPSMERRDAFCGLLSIADALRQIGARYTVARIPICYPTDTSFKEDVSRFAAICRVVNGIRGARYGQVGARPNDFWTCRFSERALQEQLGVTTIVMDLSEAIARAKALTDDEPVVTDILASLARYTDVSAIPEESLRRIAKFEAVLRDFAREAELDGMAIQCWTSLQENMGICSCTSMSRLGMEGTPCACEADINGALSMHALALATGRPAGLADWNNLSVTDPEVCNLWHCGVFPRSFFGESPTKMGVQEIIAHDVGRDNACGVIEGTMANGPVTTCRVTTDGANTFKAFIAQGEVVSMPDRTFGAGGWVRLPGLQRAYRDILLRHFPHHVALGQSHVGDVLYEALGNYLGMMPFVPDRNTDGTYRPGYPFSE